jgi:hypothetical protein
MSLKSRKAKAFVLVAVVAALLIPLAGTAARAAGTPSWQLMDYQQRTCYKAGRASPNYYGVSVKGSWTHALDAGVSGLAVGSTTWTFYVPIAPGSSDGVGSLAYVAVQIPASTPIGTYWPSCGRRTAGRPTACP